MPKFGLPDEEPVATKPAMDMLPPATKGAGASIQTSWTDPSPRSYAAPAPQVQRLPEPPAPGLHSSKISGFNFISFTIARPTDRRPRR